MEPSLSEIRYFQEASRTLNLSRAAERLSIRQSTLSAAISKLEKSLGVQLFVRSRAGVQLTQAGKHFSRAAQQFIENWESLKTATRSSQEEVQGTYTLGCHPNPGRYILPMFLPRLQKLHPELSIQLIHDRSQILNEMVISSRLDFAIVSLAAPHPDLVFIRLGYDNVGLWAHPKLKIDLKKTPLLIDLQVKHNRALLQALKRNRLEFRNIRESSSIEVIWALAEAGLGVAAMPNNPVLCSSSSPLKLLTEYPQIPAELALIFRTEARHSAAAKAIIQVIRKHCFPKKC